MANTYSHKTDTELSAEVEARLAEALAEYHADPYGFVMFAFPWGRQTLPDGSPNPLKDKQGPEAWQGEILRALGQHVVNNDVNVTLGEDLDIWRSAVSSGHGIGKSTTVAWVILWLMSTRVDTRGVVTANTESQLVDKLWPELNKWVKLAINGHWWSWAPTSLHFKPYKDGRRKNYMVTADTVSPQNTEAFQGLHNEGKTVFVIFDEASGIDDKIWEVAEGSLTDGEAFFLTFGNPTKATGAFREAVAGKHSHLYWNRQIDSRNVSHTNKKQLQHIIAKYGSDSDEARVRVYGQFPRDDDDGFLPKSLIHAATERRPESHPGEPLIMGVDVGEVRDETVCVFRRGKDAWSVPIVVLPPVPAQIENRGEYTAHLIIEVMESFNPDAVVIENLGPGIGVIAALRMLRHEVHAVYPGAPAATLKAGGDGKTHTLARGDTVDIVAASQQYGNERARYHHEGREWLLSGGGIPDDPILIEQAEDLRKAQTRVDDKLFMENKKMAYERRKKSGRQYDWRSYDRWDAFILTFAVKPSHISRDSYGRSVPKGRFREFGREADFDPLEM